MTDWSIDAHIDDDGELEMLGDEEIRLITKAVGIAQMHGVAGLIRVMCPHCRADRVPPVLRAGGRWHPSEDDADQFEACSADALWTLMETRK